jgi:hypothetical protein
MNPWVDPRDRAPPPAWPFVLLACLPTAYVLGAYYGWWRLIPFYSGP